MDQTRTAVGFHVTAAVLRMAIGILFVACAAAALIVWVPTHHDDLGGIFTIAVMLGGPGVFLGWSSWRDIQYFRRPLAERQMIEQAAREAINSATAGRIASYRNAATHICERCGEIGNPVEAKRGDVAVEILLWLFFLLPGFIYSLWRANSKRQVCPKCRADAMVPRRSPRGKALEAQYGTDLPT